MAAKGKVQWEVSITARQPGLDGFEDYNVVVSYALRRDGALLRRFQTKTLEGKLRDDFRWKIASTHPKKNALEILKEKGFA